MKHLSTDMYNDITNERRHNVGQKDGIPAILHYVADYCKIEALQER